MTNEDRKIDKEDMDILDDLYRAYDDGYNQALEDISEKIKWQYKNYKSMPSIHLFLEIVEQLKR